MKPLMDPGGGFNSGLKRPLHASGVNSSWTPGVFYKYFYNHACRLRLEKLLFIELSRSSNGFLKVLLDPGGGFRSETAVT
jgi:hypothetical protein